MPGFFQRDGGFGQADGANHVGNFFVNSQAAITTIYLMNATSGFVQGSDGGEISFNQDLNIINRETGAIKFFTGGGAVQQRLILGDNGSIGFFGSAGTTKATVTGSKGANAALSSLMTALAGYGLVTDSTT